MFDPAVAAIQYVLEHPTEDPVEFLRNWYYGEFDVLRREWPDVPEAVFAGADPRVAAPESEEEGAA